MAIVHPEMEEIERFATPLTEGEAQLLDVLIGELDDRWHIFVQPHLLNQHPDFVLVAAHHGATMIEVKDWQEGGTRASHGRLEVRDSSGLWQPTDADPLAQCHDYRSGFAERFLTPPGADSLFRAVRGVVLMSKWTGADAQQVFHDGTSLSERDARHIRVVGREIHTSRKSLKTLVYGGTAKGPGLDPRVLDRLLRRMEEPEAQSDQRRRLRLSDGALNVATNPNNATIRRVKGPAGSGKSAGLAARAAHLAAENKRVLVLSFNITLAHYLQDLVRRHARDIGADHRNVDCIHLHEFCIAILRAHRRGTKASEVSEGDAVKATRALYEDGKTALPKYDAILVDEGQDFTVDWWNFLRHHVRKNDTCEMLLVADATQDIYQRETWTEDRMIGAGFSARWSELRGCYRIPADLIPVVSEFAERYLHDSPDLPQVPRDHAGIAAAPTIRRWVNADASALEDLSGIVARELDNLLERDDGPHEADTTFLTNTHKLGLSIASALEANGRHVEHIFAEDVDDQRSSKKRFWPGVAMLKGCTVHSFKGWESRAVVIVTDDEAEAAAELTYVALSRVRGGPRSRAAFVTVVNTVPRFDDFKARFERHVGPDEVAALAGQTALELD